MSAGTVWVDGTLRGHRVRVDMESAHVVGPLAVTRVLVSVAGGALDLARGPKSWTVTHLKTGWSIVGKRRLTKTQAIAWLIRALDANDWERETMATWEQRSMESRLAIWDAMAPKKKGGAR